MNGLNNIITKINEQTELSAGRIIEESKKRAEEILAAAKNEADALTKDILDKASVKADVISSKAKSSSLLEYKRVILAKKSEIIDSVVNDALDSLCNAEDNDYFGYIESLVKSHVIAGEGVLVFNSKDLKRLPSGFSEKLAEIVSEKGSLKISEKAGNFSGGFVIEYPEMRIDCTFDSLADDKIDDIRDEISKVLFA